MKIQSKATSNWLLQHEKRLMKIKLCHQRWKITPESTKIFQVRSVSREGSSGGIKKRQHHENRNNWSWYAKYVLLSRGTRNNYISSGSTQESIGAVLTLGQCFALMPVRGVMSKSANDLKFSWCHLRTIYSLGVIVCFGGCAGIAIAQVSRNGVNFDSMEGVVFHSSIFLFACVFLNLARKWPKVAVKWQEVEQRLPPMRTQMEKSWLKYRIKMIIIVLMSCSLLEHLLNILSILYYVNACPAIPGHPISSYLYTNFSDFFHFFEFSTLAGIIGKVLNIMSTFVWNYNDIFVMSISVALVAKFRQLNNHMMAASKRPSTEAFWIKCRTNYRSLCRLCYAVDDAISTVTLLCLFNNLYFICNKILKSIQKKPTYAHTLYFWFSLWYLLVRTLVLSLYTADVHEESKRPLIIFRGISSEDWNRELKRFSKEVADDVVALTGMKFFNLTRGMVLSVAGTILTYEMVLLQFNKEPSVSDCQ